jgi:hypothetical protein
MHTAKSYADKLQDTNLNWEDKQTADSVTQHLNEKRQYVYPIMCGNHHFI